MNQCYQCKKPIATLLKLRYLSLEAGHYCPHCRSEISYSLYWALACVLLSVFIGLFAGVYLSEPAPVGESIPMLLTTWASVTLAGVLLTASFLPLVPYQDRTHLIFMAWMVVIFGFGFAIIFYALFSLIWPF